MKRISILFTGILCLMLGATCSGAESSRLLENAEWFILQEHLFDREEPELENIFNGEERQGQAETAARAFFDQSPAMLEMLQNQQPANPGTPPTPPITPPEPLVQDQDDLQALRLTTPSPQLHCVSRTPSPSDGVVLFFKRTN